MVEYDIQRILQTIAIVLLIFIPLLIVMCCIVNVIVRKIKGEGSSASWNYLNSLDKPRRASVSKAETTPLKSAATLADADSGIGISNPIRKTVASTLEKSAPSAPPRPKEDPDHALDGVYYTNEPLPGKPNVDFEDKIWDFDDDDVFKSKSNSSLSSPLAGRENESPPQASKPVQYSSILKPSSKKTEDSPPELPKTLPPSPSQIPKGFSSKALTFSGPNSPASSLPSQPSLPTPQSSPPTPKPLPPLPQTAPPLPQSPPPQSPTKRLPPPLIPSKVSNPSTSSRNSSIPNTPRPSPVSSDTSGSVSGVRVNKTSISTAI